MSPMASMVGRAVLDWDQEIYFPRPKSSDVLTVGMAVNNARYLQSGYYAGDIAQTDVMVSVTAAAGGSAVYDPFYAGPLVPGGNPVMRVHGGAPGDSIYVGLGGIAAVLPITPLGPGIAAGASYPSLSRVWWLKTLINLYPDGGANPANEIGLLVVPTNGGIPHSWPTQIPGVNNRGGFGIVQDGAGNWIYRSFDRTAAGLVRESLVLPAHNPNDWNQAEWVMVARRPGFPAYLEFWFNSTLVCTRNWGGGLLEPIGGDPVADIREWQWMPSTHLLNANVFMFQGVMRAGRFLRDGTEIQG